MAASIPLPLQPVTVTHCVRTNCTRVFTAAPSSEPLEIGVGGWGGRLGPGLLLMIGSVRYHPETGQPLTDGAGELPYDPSEFVVTTWQQWLTSHPDTDLYQGIDPFSSGSPLQDGSPD